MDRKTEVLQIIDRAKREGRVALLEDEAKKICLEHGIPVPRFIVAKSPTDALKSARKIGYPLVCKVLSRDVLHKSEFGGVILNIRTDRELTAAYQKIMENVKKREPKARIAGVMLEEMVDSGIEVVVGMLRDVSFGPTIMFGLGGVLVEVLKDVFFRVAPLDNRDAQEMMEEIKGYEMLRGFRGTPPADMGALRKIILSVSDLAVTYPEIQQIDLNPIIIRGSHAKVADARMIVRN